MAVMLSHLQNKNNIKKNRDKIVNRDFPEKNRDMIFLPYRPPLTQTDRNVKINMNLGNFSFVHIVMLIISK